MNSAGYIIYSFKNRKALITSFMHKNLIKNYTFPLYKAGCDHDLYTYMNNRVFLIKENLYLAWHNNNSLTTFGNTQIGKLQYSVYRQHIKYLIMKKYS